MDAGSHNHHAIQLVMAFGHDLRIEVQTVEHECRAALVPSNVPHRFWAAGRDIALLLVDPQSASGVQLEEIARGRGSTQLDDHVPAAGPGPDLPANALMGWAEAVVDSVIGNRSMRPLLSPGVRAALRYVQREIDGPVRLAEAASAAGISPTRLTHAFSSEVGLPFRRYVLWARTKRAVEEVRRGASLTQAAATAGFSDSAHLSRTFRRAFGLPPSFLLAAGEIAGTFLDTP